MKLAIDPGHGGSDPGGAGLGKLEKNVVLDISYAIFHQAAAMGIPAILTRTGDKDVALSTRYEIANRSHANLFMSIHVNADGGRGLEVLYGKDNAKAIARDLVNALHAATGWPIRRGNGLWYRPGVAVLLGTQMPAVLSENGFIDYPEENAAMSDPAWIERVAKAHVDVAAKYFGVTSPAGEGEEEEMKFYAQRTDLRNPDGWHIYNIPSCNAEWWIDISNEYDVPVRIRIFANPQDKTAQIGGYGEFMVPNTRAERPGIHARLKTLAKGLKAEWSEVSIHTESPLSILVGN